MSKKVQFIIWTIVAVLIIALIGVCVLNYIQKETKGNTHPEVSIEFENYGTVKFELYPEYAPNTVANFIALANAGYYNEKVLYGKDKICLYMGRDENGEVVDPSTETIGYTDVDNYNYAIDGEFVVNGFEQNTLSHEKGVISLIRNNYTEYFSSLYEESYNSGNAQIGIMMSDDASSLNGFYAAFGKVVEGMDVLEKIYNEAEIAVKEDDEATEEVVEDDKNDAKAEEATEEAEEETEVAEDDDSIKEFATYPKITAVTIDTHGIEYGLPVIHEAFDYNSFIQSYISSMSGNY